MKKKKIIIAIHGLGIKPHKWLLKHWWKKAIHEGLNNINKNKFFFKLSMSYWSDILHPKPLSVFIFNKKDPLFLNEPYKKTKSKGEKESFAKLKMFALNKLEDIIDKASFKKNRIFNLDIIFESVIKILFKDLDAYYRENVEDKTARIKDEMRSRLTNLLNKYKNYEILLIAHSMGTIISYDVLTYCLTDVKINTFVTIGSPLGMPYVMKKIFKEQGKTYKKTTLLDTPECIKKSWFNFSDLDDKVAIIYRLANNYKANSNNVAPVDITVQNDYEY